MTLPELIKRRQLVVLGLNSGTSADGLDLAAVKINFHANKINLNFLAGKTVSYPRDISARIHEAMNGKMASFDEVILLDRQLGAFYGAEAGRFCAYLKRKGISIDLVASHGQTVRHLPEKLIQHGKKESASLQLGHPESIAERTGRITVADFRQADLAAGGEGAPITAYAMWLLFSRRKENRLLLNIGGIANYFLFPAGGNYKKIRARDCGPGNSLIDILALRLFGRKYDADGQLAAKGTISRRLLSLLLSDKFLKGKFGVSTGRERFGEKFAERILKTAGNLHLNNHDIMATFTEMTALSISKSIRDELNGHEIKKIYIFGGGFKNTYLLDRISRSLPGINLLPVDKMGFNPDFLEATCYALMGGLAIRGMASGLPQITGARNRTIAGRIVQPGETIK